MISGHDVGGWPARVLLTVSFLSSRFFFFFFFLTEEFYRCEL